MTNINETTAYAATHGRTHVRQPCWPAINTGGRVLACVCVCVCVAEPWVLARAGVARKMHENVAWHRSQWQMKDNTKTLSRSSSRLAKASEVPDELIDACAVVRARLQPLPRPAHTAAQTRCRVDRLLFRAAPKVSPCTSNVISTD